MRLHSDMRYVADYLASQKDWDRFCEMVQDNSQTVTHENLLLDVLEELSGERRFQKIKNLLGKKTGKEERKEEVRMAELLEWLEEVGRKKGRIEGLREGRREGRKEGRKEGRQQGYEKGRDETSLKAIRNLAKTMDLTPEEAMKALKIPKKRREYYLGRL